MNISLAAREVVHPLLHPHPHQKRPSQVRPRIDELALVDLDGMVRKGNAFEFGDAKLINLVISPCDMAQCYLGKIGQRGEVLDIEVRSGRTRAVRVFKSDVI